MPANRLFLGHSAGLPRQLMLGDVALLLPLLLCGQPSLHRTWRAAPASGVLVLALNLRLLRALCL